LLVDFHLKRRHRPHDKLINKESAKHTSRPDLMAPIGQ
jgi:hypothetical protein